MRPGKRPFAKVDEGQTTVIKHMKLGPKLHEHGVES